MKILNPILMNKWPKKKFFIVIISFQLLVWGSIGLDSIGIKIPLLRQMICFIYLSFVPGILLIRILKLHNLNTIEVLLYSVGLSVSMVMFTGLFINVFYPSIGISKPISILPLILTISLIVFFLCIFCHKYNYAFSKPDYLDLKEFFSIHSLFLYLIPLLTVIGTYLMNFQKNNFLLILVIILISSTIVLVTYNIIPTHLYPLAIFMSSVSLLFHNSLISMHVSGWDIQTEFYLANKVINDCLWDASLYSNVNSMLSIVMLAPIYSILLDLNLTWVFKIIYPLIFSLTPIGLYVITQKQTNDIIAFMSSFFFISFFVFFNEMLQILRQQIAEFFLILVLLLIVLDKHSRSYKILLILFSFSMIVSHYGLSYIVLGSIFACLLLSLFYYKFDINRFKNNTINFSFAALLIVFLITWYMYISSSSAFHTIVHIFDIMKSNFVTDFLNPSKAEGIYILTKETATQLHKLYKIMHILTQIFITIGLSLTFYSYIKGKKTKFYPEYLFLSLVMYILLIAAILVPNFASNLNTSRLYHITLILLSPFCIIGAISSFDSLSTKKTQLWKNQRKYSLKILSIFFAIFILFNTGWIYEITNDSPTSFSLSKKMDYPIFNEQEISGKDWMIKFGNFGTQKSYENVIYADSFRLFLFISSFDRSLVSALPNNPNDMNRNSYIFCSSYNILHGTFLFDTEVDENTIRNYHSTENYTITRNKIYSNDGSQFYY